MTAHACTTLNPNCWRCELNLDELPRCPNCRDPLTEDNDAPTCDDHPTCTRCHVFPPTCPECVNVADEHAADEERERVFERERDQQ